MKTSRELRRHSATEVTGVTGIIRSPKDFWAGMIYAVIGAGAWWIGRNYAFGTGARMGPGYFPAVLSAVLFMFGVACIVRSVLTDGEAVGALAWKPLSLVTLGTVGFGFLLPRAGLVAAIIFFGLVAGSASQQFRLGWRPLLGLFGFAAVCALVFVQALGVSMPLLGSWLSD